MRVALERKRKRCRGQKNNQENPPQATSQATSTSNLCHSDFLGFFFSKHFTSPRNVPCPARYGRVRRNGNTAVERYRDGGGAAGVLKTSSFSPTSSSAVTRLGSSRPSFEWFHQASISRYTLNVTACALYTHHSHTLSHPTPLRSPLRRARSSRVPPLRTIARTVVAPAGPARATASRSSSRSSRRAGRARLDDAR